MPRTPSSVAAALATTTTLLGALLAGPPLAGPATAAASGDTTGSAGSAGIGDPYFPLDGNGGYDVAHYDVRDTYRPRSGLLSGSTRISATATQELSRFHLDLLLPARSVHVDGHRAHFRRGGSHELVVTPRTPLAAGSHFTIRVSYAGRPAAAGYLGEHNWLSSPTETVTMNEPHMAPWWFAANDHPDDKATYDLRITGPADQQVIAGGERVGTRVHDGVRTTHWRLSDPAATYLVYFAMGSFEIRHGVLDGRPWLVAVSRQLAPRLRRHAMRGMLASPRVVRWLESQLGPYPFTSTGGLTTALDPGFSLEDQTRPTYPVLGRAQRTTVVHELAHQWFGDSVSVADWRDIWLNEGLATYMEVRYAETHGGRSAQTWLTRAYDHLRERPAFWRRAVSDPGRDHIFDTEVYLRGGMTAAALRHRIGDAAFTTLMQTWTASHRHGNGSSAEFETLAGQVAGTDLTGFFEAWLRAPEPPARTAANGLS